jgi:ElaB/YqjD/DUF883 family membrane-anchored ribosome-binding protein
MAPSCRALVCLLFCQRDIFQARRFTEMQPPLPIVRSRLALAFRFCVNHALDGTAQYLQFHMKWILGSPRKEKRIVTTTNHPEAARTIYESKDEGCSCSGASSETKLEADAFQSGKEVASDLGQKLQETAKVVGRQVQASVKSFGDKAQASVANLTQNTDRMISDVGQRFREAAQNLRRSAPRESTIGSTAVALADNLEAGGQYLQDHGVEDMVGDLSSLIRRHPMQAMFITLTTGFLVGTALKRR